MVKGLKWKRLLAIAAQMMPAATGPAAGDFLAVEKSIPATKFSTPPLKEEEVLSALVTPALPPHNVAALKEVCVGGS